MVILRRWLNIHSLKWLKKLPPVQSRCCSTAKEAKEFVPRRACMYVPGNDEKKLRKIPGMGADCVIMDCEDGVALSKKEDARHTIKSMLDSLEFGCSEPVVRVNALTSGLSAEDVQVCLSAQRLPPTVMLPKVDHSTDLDQFSEILSNQLKKRPDPGVLNLIIFTESAVGLLNLQSICDRALSLQQQGAPIHLQGVVFGSDDFCADIGASRTKDAKELLFARQNIVVVAKAFGLQAIDLVHIDFKDTEGLLAQSLEGAQMGFTGKQCIHPLQVPIVQQAFSPSQEKVEWATELVKAFTEHQSSGKGAFTFRGSMIDMPLLLQAKNILKMEKATKTEKT